MLCRRGIGVTVRCPWFESKPTGSRSKDLQTNAVMAAEEQGLATVVPENGVRGSRNELALRITRQDAALEVLETTIGEVVM